MIQGAIDMSHISVKDIMIQFADIFSLKYSKKINYKNAAKISKAGFSRIPVYKGMDRH